MPKNGADLAEPGEFTKRAFLGGRIDLSQAESIIDIINAKSDREAKEGIKQLEGYLSEKINDIKNDLLEIMTNIEVSIDYPEYDTPYITNNDILKTIENIRNKLDSLKKSFDNGKIIKQGIKTVIIGKPNAGKSSLLNAILKEDRAIVTEIEGTTRDTIEEFVSLEGVPLKIIDTAGIRNAQDEVEKIGVDKAVEISQKSDIIIAIFDISRELNDEDQKIINLIKDKNAIIVLNKIDKQIKANTDEIEALNKPTIRISTVTKEGINTLYEEIKKMFNLENIASNGELIVSNTRHKSAIINARKNLEEALLAIDNNMPIDIISGNIREILVELGKITGETVTEDVINEIFSKFCLGK